MSCFKRAALAAALALSLFVNALGARAETSAPQTPAMRDAFIAREIAVLELVCGSPLAPEEQKLAAEAVASALRGNPDAWIHDSATWAPALARAGGDPAYAAALRQKLRLHVEEAKPSSPGLEESDVIERKIIHAHDATVAFDPKRSHIVTEATLRDLRQATLWFAVQAGLPGPSPDFIGAMRAWVKANYASADDVEARALANMAENFTVTPRVFASLDAKKRGTVLTEVRQQIEAADAPMRDVWQGVAAAILAEHSAQRVQNEAKNNALPVDHYMAMARTAILGYGAVLGINRHGPFH